MRERTRSQKEAVRRRSVAPHIRGRSFPLRPYLAGVSLDKAKQSYTGRASCARGALVSFIAHPSCLLASSTTSAHTRRAEEPTTAPCAGQGRARQFGAMSTPSPFTVVQPYGTAVAIRAERSATSKVMGLRYPGQRILVRQIVDGWALLDESTELHEMWISDKFITSETLSSNVVAAEGTSTASAAATPACAFATACVDV